MFTFTRALIALIEAVAALVHIGEEQKKGAYEENKFPFWFRRLWGYPGGGNFPLNGLRNLLVNTVGLALTLVGLAIVGIWHPEAEAAYIGFTLTDAAAHLVLSLLPWARRRTGTLSPGWITSFMYIGIAVWRWDVVLANPKWAVAGGLVLAFTYFEAGVKVAGRYLQQAKMGRARRGGLA